MDLFTPVVSEEAQHPYLRSLWKQANGFNCDVQNEWARGFKDRDGKFVKEFQTTFDSSFWELYLFAIIKQFQLEVDFSFTSPDFFITNHDGMNVEATVASHARVRRRNTRSPERRFPLIYTNSIDRRSFALATALIRNARSTWNRIQGSRM